MVRAHPNRSKNVRKYALSLLGKKAEPPLSPQGIGEGEGYTIVPSRSMQVLHTPRGYGGRLPHPVRGGLSSSSELLPARVITAIEAGHPIKHRVDL